ncbi:hypothetical protein B5C34_03200 [Pacificimonas flava]|uniref:Phospholipid/glycerol acyltransferase domain-containing protein n=2 Tax=Pacificimonas TaxID=1960290 RepID=A0A219B2K8_9SPHN|nr:MULTISPECIES: lysophospholipid acyltransferase family protein [Pacificimonas]MBZ6377774.1 1-acyl-sn-glycerol-3-phosphate acyltransferase [Pacificimonas aurantium]OWV32551.1 hypothetical protein B5C34_03200 [Pacificimonas flava]
MTLLRNIVFSVLFYLFSAVFSIGLWIVSLVKPSTALPGASAWSRGVRWLTRYILGIRIEIDGELPHGRCIVAPKHESFFEALMLPALFPNAAVVMKRELSRIPVWGDLVQRHASIFVDRTAGGQAMRSMLTAAKAARAAEREILIFPEGSRAPPGEAPPIRSGVAGLYRMLDLPVVPIALTSAHVWPKSGLKRPGVVRWRVMPEIPAGLQRREFEMRLHDAINAEQPKLA